MRTTHETHRHPTTRTRRSSVDPYCVEFTTWTREELLAARAAAEASVEAPAPTRIDARRRPVPHRGPKAA